MPEQRRLVTVVFADVVGSTALAEELDAEDVRAFFTRYYAVATAVVEAHGGIVAKLLGDGVLACFGIPAAHGDDAQRAIDAALALREGVSRDAALQRVQLRIGVNTGEVLANDDASGEIVGDAVNVAARVAAAAAEGEILVADTSHRAALTASFGERREIAAKGKSRPVAVWPVLGRGMPQHRWTTPFVGREDDLAQLELVARRAFRDRRPYLVTVTAPPGAGKSRLVEEFRKRVGDGPSYAHAHFPPYGQVLAFGPLRELLCDVLGLPGEASADDVRVQIAEVLGGDEGTRDAQLISLTVAPEGVPAEQDEERVLAAWRHLLAGLAARRPLLVVLEDLQNASDIVLDLIEEIVQPGVAAPILVVCLARPDLLERRASWGGGRRNSLNLALEPLGDREISAVVASLLETEPPALLRERVVERAAGNPFFAEELVRALLERGPVDLADDVAVERALGALPETVQATVLARIDLLPMYERAVLQSAAVVGPTFGTAVLRVVCDVRDDVIDAALAGLVERELVVPGGAGIYAFRNALVRDVAYGMLPRARRARDHARIAQHLAQSAGDRADELASLIGLHYLEATRLLRASAVPTGIEGVDAERTRAEAVQWTARGARTSAALGAWAASLKALQETLTIAASDDERIHLLLQLGETAVGGDFAWDALGEALRLWRARPDGDPAIGARAITDALVMLFRSGVSISRDRFPDMATQERLAAEALELARRSNDERIRATALFTHAYLERARPGRSSDTLEAARDEAREAAALLEKSGDMRGWSQARDVWAAIEGDLGDLRRARAVAMARIERIEELPPTERAHARWTMPIYEMALGDVRSARSFIDLAYAEPALAGSGWAFAAVVGQVFLLGWRAAADWALGDWDAAIADTREGLGPLAKIPDPAMRSVFAHAASASLYVGRRRSDSDLVALVTGRVRGWCDDERVLALLDDDPSALESALDRVTTSSIDTWMVERSLSIVNAYGRTPARPLGALVAYAEARGLRPLHAQLLRLRARQLGSADDARRAHELLAACEMRADAALAGVELALLGDRSHLAAARAELERLGDARGLALANG